jgi:hypothetical protein
MQDKAGIRDQFIKTLGRNDITPELANVFLDQAISRIQRTLRVPAMEKIVEFVTVLNQRSIIIPGDFLSMKEFYSGENEVTYLPMGRFLARSRDPGEPQNYTRAGGELLLSPRPTVGTELTLIYYGEIPDLVEDADTNFLCAIAPDLLVYGALCFAADHFVDDRKQAFEDGFTRIYSELEEQALLVEMQQIGPAITAPYNLEY